MSSRRRKQLLAIPVLAVLTAAPFLVAKRESAAAPHVTIRGQDVAADSFNLKQLHDPAARRRADDYRRDRFVECMESKGFHVADDAVSGNGDGSKFSLAYSIAAIGDEGGSTPPGPRAVELPDGTSYPIYTTWTPDSCIYQSFVAAGAPDPFEREALRQVMMIYIADAERAIVGDKEFAPLARSFNECLNGRQEADGYLLMQILDDDLRMGDVHFPSQGDAIACAEAVDVAKYRSIRGRHHMAVAARGQANVDAWVALVDHELATVGTG